MFVEHACVPDTFLFIMFLFFPSRQLCQDGSVVLGSIRTPGGKQQKAHLKLA